MDTKPLDDYYTMKYCRFCAEQKTEADLLDLAMYTFSYQEVEDKLRFLNIDYVDLTNDLPKNICFLCNTSLNSAYDFFSSVKRCQEHLIDIVRKRVKFETLTENKANKTDVITETLSTDTSLALHELPNAVKTFIKLENSQPESESENDFDDTFNETDSVQNNEKDEVDDILATYNGLPVYEEGPTEITERDIKESWSGYPWLCSECDDSFSEVSQLRQHCKSDHNVCSAFKCADCGEGIDKFEPFIEHVKAHRDILRFYCHYCNKQYDELSISIHIQDHTENGCVCDKCGNIFKTESQLRSHNNKYKEVKTRNLKKKRRRIPIVNPLADWEIEQIEDKSWLGYPWSCQLCDMEFSEVGFLRSHSKKMHDTCFTMKCADCKETMESYRGFVMHAKKHRPFLKQYCHYCNYKFVEEKIDVDHIAEHFEGPLKVCEGCGEMFQDNVQLQTHIANHNPPKLKKYPYLRRERPLTLNDLTCHICNKVMKTLNSLRSHSMVHTNRNRDYTCEICGKTFYTKGALKCHKSTHEENEEVCKICRKAFNSHAKLKRHVRTHQEEKPFSCEICRRCFRKKSHLVDHSKIHSNEMPYQCQFCEKTFRYRNNLKTHEHQHTGARPYSCSDCTMEFSNWANCNKHMKRKHGKTLAKSTMTPLGKLPINPKNGKPKKPKDLETVKEWTEKILAPLKRGKKPKSEHNADS